MPMLLCQLCRATSWVAPHLYNPENHCERLRADLAGDPYTCRGALMPQVCNDAQCNRCGHIYRGMMVAWDWTSVCGRGGCPGTCYPIDGPQQCSSCGRSGGDRVQLACGRCGNFPWWNPFTAIGGKPKKKRRELSQKILKILGKGEEGDRTKGSKRADPSDAP